MHQLPFYFCGLCAGKQHGLKVLGIVFSLLLADFTSCEDNENLFFLYDPTDNPGTTVSGRVGNLVVRLSMDNQCSAVSRE